MLAVKGCWNVGALSTDALRTVVTIGVSMGQDGKPDSGSIRMIGYEGGDETAARGAFDVKTSLKKLIRFPALYAIAAGFLVNQMGLEPPELFWTYWAYFKGAYVCMGMMIVGAALSNVERLVFGPRFMAFVFFGKFVAWPVLIYAFVAFDRAILQWYTPDIHNLMLIMSLVPPAANIAAFAAQMNLKPEKAATTILAGTVFALLYIPAMIWLFGIQ